MEAFRAWAAQLDWSYLLDIAVLTAASLLCITFHEMCHGLAAYALGDPTAKRAGRLTLNPIKHVDIVGLIMMAVAKFGWAKPVPIDARYFKNPKAGMAVTSIAGPLGNVFLCVLASVGYGAGAFVYVCTGLPAMEYLLRFFYYVLLLSAGLAVFNLLPVPPLDGSKVFFSILPQKWYWKLMRYERYGMIVLMVLLLTGTLDVPLNFLREGLVSLMDPIMEGTFDLLYALSF